MTSPLNSPNTAKYSILSEANQILRDELLLPHDAQETASNLLPASLLRLCMDPDAEKISRYYRLPKDQSTKCLRATEAVGSDCVRWSETKKMELISYHAARILSPQARISFGNTPTQQNLGHIPEDKGSEQRDYIVVPEVVGKLIELDKHVRFLLAKTVLTSDGERFKSFGFEECVVLGSALDLHSRLAERFNSEPSPKTPQPGSLYL